MFINPKEIIENGYFKGNNYKLSPNGIDFSVDRIFTIPRSATITKNSKEFEPGIQEVPLKQLTETDSNEEKLQGWKLNPGVYDIFSDCYIELPENIVAFLHIRSSFSRAGVILSSGVYDSGFKGHIGCAIHVSRPITIEKQTAIGQVVFMVGSSYGMYAGYYNTQQGNTWFHLKIDNPK